MRFALDVLTEIENEHGLLSCQHPPALGQFIVRTQMPRESQSDFAV